MKEISIIVPVFNEEDNIAELHKEIVDVCSGKFLFEIIIVDDGSADRTCEIVKNLSPVRYIRFRKNFGQTAAMDAGIKSAKYNYILTMDGDRQNDPDEIPNLIRHLEENDLDVVSGWRKNRKDSFMKKFVSRGANFLRGILIHDGIHDSGCSLKIYRKECFDQVSLYGEMHRFIPAILKIKGFKIGEIPVNHRPRTKGYTKYNWRRTFRGFIDMISVWFWNKYAIRPLHLLGGLGFFSMFLGLITFLYSLVMYFQIGKIGHTAWPVLAAFFLFTGILLFLLGLIADILIKSYYSTTPDKSYNIKEVGENPGSQ
ncbi:MAG: glycosyltransferase family 2 protein [Bacteroidia bacterium]|nr:glycosyltransferase family 2 protein [Bacteroidia bacterium]